MPEPILHQKGFTLIELLFVIAIILILSAVTIEGFQMFASRAKHTEGAHVVLGALQEAHARTLASEGDTSYGVHFGAGSAVIFSGTTYIAGDVTNDVRTLPAQTSITNTSLSGGGNEVYFARLSGDATPTGTVTVSSTRDAAASSTIIIYRTGLSEIK